MILERASRILPSSKCRRETDIVTNSAISEPSLFLFSFQETPINDSLVFMDQYSVCRLKTILASLTRKNGFRNSSQTIFPPCSQFFQLIIWSIDRRLGLKTSFNGTGYFLNLNLFLRIFKLLPSRQKTKDKSVT